MATILNKKLVRETTEKVEDKEILITLTSDQKVELRLKGQRSGVKDISILDLYNQLYDLESSSSNITTNKSNGSLSIKKNNKSNKSDNRKMISLYDLRSQNAISTLDVKTMSKFDEIIKSVIDAI